MSSINTEFYQKYFRYQGFLEDALDLSIFYHCIILLQHRFFSMRLQYIEQLSPFYTYTHKKNTIFWWCKCSILLTNHIFTNLLFFWINTIQSHIFLFYSRAALTDIPHIFFHPLIFLFLRNKRIKFFITFFMSVSAGDTKFQCYQIYF